MIDVLDQYLHSISMINDDQKLYNITENPNFPDEVYFHIEGGAKS